MSMSILSTDGNRKAVVTPCDNGAIVDCYRRNPQNTTWHFIYQVLMPVPYHAALDQAHSLINA